LQTISIAFPYRKVAEQGKGEGDRVRAAAPEGPAALRASGAALAVALDWGGHEVGLPVSGAGAALSDNGRCHLQLNRVLGHFW
jgi:hypothetical protein